MQAFGQTGVPASAKGTYGRVLLPAFGKHFWQEARISRISAQNRSTGFPVFSRLESLPAQAFCNAVLNQKFLTALRAFAPSEQDHFHRRVEYKRGTAVRADDPVLVEYKFGGAFHRADILLPLYRPRDEPLPASGTFQVVPIDALAVRKRHFGVAMRAGGHL